MVDARIESLDARRLLSGSVAFGDLVSLAQIYNSSLALGSTSGGGGPAWSNEVYTPPGERSLAYVMAGGSYPSPSASVSSKGKLTVRLIAATEVKISPGKNGRTNVLFSYVT